LIGPSKKRRRSSNYHREPPRDRFSDLKNPARQVPDRSASHIPAGDSLATAGAMQGHPVQPADIARLIIADPAFERREPAKTVSQHKPHRGPPSGPTVGRVEVTTRLAFGSGGTYAAGRIRLETAMTECPAWSPRNA